jgi:hypothetical protein
MKAEDVLGMIYPIPPKLASRILDETDIVFVKFAKRPILLERGSKLFFYQSSSGQVIVGEARIDEIQIMSPTRAISEYGSRLPLNRDEFWAYVGKRENRNLLVLSLSNIKRYNRPAKTSKSVTMAGQYMTRKLSKELSIGR